MSKDEPAGLARADLIGPLLAQVTGDPEWRAATAHLITGGHSNLTYLLRSPAGELILRRPPNGDVLATAHDMGREVRVQRALAGSPVPVPRIVLEDGGALFGTPFYVMTKVSGLVIKDVLPSFSQADRRRLGEDLVKVLADLHTLPPQEVGLADFGRPQGFAERQVRRWREQIASTPTEPVPELEVLAERLARRPPGPAPVAIVHGDYRLDNCVVNSHEPGRINAVLDWEMSTLGDPLTDLGLLLFYWDAAERLEVTPVGSATGQAGFPTVSEVAEMYADRTGFDLGELTWYRAFAHFKFAAIVLGIQARVRAGAMGGQEFGELHGLPARLAEAALELPAI